MIMCELNYDEMQDGKLKLKCIGVREFEIFTGKGGLKNIAHCSNTSDGAIPVGTYYIVERKNLGGIKNTIRNLGITASNVVNLRSNDKTKWFALYNAQTMSDATKVDGNMRGGFRLHPVNSDGSGYSDGCITFQNYNSFFILRNALLNTIPDEYWKLKGINAYGVVRVLGNPDFSKCTVRNV